ncbi:MAG: c-type cytochrome [Deltaproteobacteria bacterium]|nr:c-type cytochrome [Deltaproteobacteria bacterium]
MKRVAILLVAIATLGACSRTEKWTEQATPSEGSSTEVTTSSGSAVPSAAVSSEGLGTVARVAAGDMIEKFQCARCHEVPQTGVAERDKHCFTCHQQIHDGTFDAKPETLVKWRGRIQSLRHAPSLAHADRLQRAWVKRFLLHPHDVRPGSIAEMPRLAISDAEADRLATFLVPVEDAAPIDTAPALVARGEKLYRDLACGRCHRFTGAAVDDAALHAGGRVADPPPPAIETDPARRSLAIAWTLAPDLRFARDRVQPAQLAAWIEAPRGAMPKLSISRDDARALAAFLVATPVVARSNHVVPKRLPILEREVPWAEVSARVFHDTCWHCHAVPDFAHGDGGPGNSGGFGFAPRGLDLSSYTGISQGAFDRGSERRSIFEKLPDGTPRVVAHLMARHVEAAGGSVDGIRGMPLGIPALTLEQIQLVDTWIAQGRPQ